MNAHPHTAAIWSFNRRLTHRLAAWSLLSIAAGAALLRGGRPFQRALGTQNIVWGIIDGAIALGGQQAAENKQASATPTDDGAHARQLRRVLWLNAGLDLLYIVGGLRLFSSRPALPSHRLDRKGHGIGIMVQGAFLLIFDLAHALRVPHIDQSRGGL